MEEKPRGALTRVETAPSSGSLSDPPLITEDGPVLSPQLLGGLKGTRSSQAHTERMLEPEMGYLWGPRPGIFRYTALPVHHSLLSSGLSQPPETCVRGGGESHGSSSSPVGGPAAAPGLGSQVLRRAWVEEAEWPYP